MDYKTLSDKEFQAVFDAVIAEDYRRHRVRELSSEIEQLQKDYAALTGLDLASVKAGKTVPVGNTPKA